MGSFGAELDYTSGESYLSVCKARSWKSQKIHVHKPCVQTFEVKRKSTNEEDVGNSCICSELEMCIISNTFLYVYLFHVLLRFVILKS